MSFFFIIHSKIKKKIFPTPHPTYLSSPPLPSPSSFRFTFSLCNHFLLFHCGLPFISPLPWPLLLVGSSRYLLYLLIQFAYLISFNVTHLVLTFFFFSEGGYDPCLSGALPLVPTRLVPGNVICTFGQFSYHMDCLLLPVEAICTYHMD